MKRERDRHTQTHTLSFLSNKHTLLSFTHTHTHTHTHKHKQTHTHTHTVSAQRIFKTLRNGPKAATSGFSYILCSLHKSSKLYTNHLYFNLQSFCQWANSNSYD